MAKKTTAPAPFATQLAPKSRKETKANIPTAQRYFWDYAELSWKYAKDYQEQLAARRPLFTTEYIEEQLAYIATVKAMPTRQVRSAKSKKSRISLSAHRQVILSEADLLESAIRFTYKDQQPLTPAELEESGITALRAATSRDWAAVSVFITTADIYLAGHLQELVDAGAIPPTFALDLKTKGNAFNTAKTEFTDGKQSAKDGTDALAEGIRQIKTAIGNMQKTGKIVFEFEPETRKLFTEKYLLDAVRSHHPARIVGRTELGPVVQGMKPKPLAGILVEVLGEPGKTAITDPSGRYKIPIAGGEYPVRYSGEGMAPVQIKVTVKPGVDRRINVALEPVPEGEPTATPLPKIAAPPPHVMDEALSNAIHQLNREAENGALVATGAE